MIRLLRRALAAALCFTMVSTFLPGLAKANPQGSSVNPEQVRVQQAIKLRPFTHFTDRGITFAEKEALASGADAAVVHSVSALYNHLNTSLTQEHFDWAKLLTEKATVEVKDKAGLILPDASSSGNWFWWRISFTEWETQLIVKSLAAAAGTVGLCALLAALPGVTLPAAVLFAIAGAALGLGAVYIDLVDWIGHSNGVYWQGTMTTGLYFWHN